VGAWGPGIFDDDVAADAMSGNDVGPNIQRWAEDASPADAAAREQILTALRDRLEQSA
jgi:hypothetical protein